MGQFTRTELEDAFQRWQDVAASCDWSAWADLFTEDATYIEHHYGTMHGRDEIKKWIVETMSTFPGDEMPYFPPEWHIVDEERGWIVCYVQNRMRDPGDGTVHQSPNVTILHYAGHGLWSYEEDVYNPAHFKTMIRGWLDRVRQLEGKA